MLTSNRIESLWSIGSAGAVAYSFTILTLPLVEKFRDLRRTQRERSQSEVLRLQGGLRDNYAVFLAICDYASPGTTIFG